MIKTTMHTNEVLLLMKEPKLRRVTFGPNFRRAEKNFFKRLFTGKTMNSIKLEEIITQHIANTAFNIKASTN